MRIRYTEETGFWISLHSGAKFSFSVAALNVNSSLVASEI